VVVGCVCMYVYVCVCADMAPCLAGMVLPWWTPSTHPMSLNPSTSHKGCPWETWSSPWWTEPLPHRLSPTSEHICKATVPGYHVTCPLCSANHHMTSWVMLRATLQHLATVVFKDQPDPTKLAASAMRKSMEKVFLKRQPKWLFLVTPRWAA
jgi:hypothetical protein